MQGGTSALPFPIQAKLEAKKSVPAWAVYMKMQTDMLRDVLAKEPALKNGPIRTLEDLTPEQRITIERLAANAGVGFAAKAFRSTRTGRRYSSQRWHQT